MATGDDFALQIEAFARQAIGRVQDVERSVVLQVMTSLVLKSPVGDPSRWKDPESAPPGYVGGRFRGEWQYTYNALPTSTVGSIDATGQVSIGRAIIGRKRPGIHYLTNLMSYGRKLEYDGHSSQAPNGMVGITVREFDGLVASTARGAR
jgi:hypothetical protein